MSDPVTAQERTRTIEQMFSRLVPHYDRMNRLMTGGRDGRWRTLAVRLSKPEGSAVLDLGAGTGDLSAEFRRQDAARVTALDVSAHMLTRAEEKFGRQQIDWLRGDALHLPFADASFDVVASAFVMRNLPDLAGSFEEMARVLKPGGRLVGLDITHPPDSRWGKVLRLGFEQGVTRVAGLVSGDRSAYRYLPNSLSGYPTADELSAMLESAGLIDVSYRRLSMGVVALHIGRKS
ncbi:MAG: ubiquinone/menaquinone biosynthesis methyltransferase [Chloroflexi bacterium]|nr:ubiquinone/menaquinone biosynthesis methyltransferase [Chloroflexota bacterium]MYC01121.1 ubiquinone/menaquinone biosynthesis methyltransferase [Chloroflexota bacterium]MYD74322.1 ubiquinone/menaquinone biosynthesis methyltransferase [Chloroflexota bacterium]